MNKILVCTLTMMFLWMALLSTKSTEGNEYDRGRNLYENRCQMCHGQDGKGNGPASAAFNPKPANFTDPKFWQRKDIDKFITDNVENGHGMMPAFNLKPGEIKAIIEYLSQAFKK